MKTLADIPLKENDRRAIKQAVRVLLEKFPIEMVILFGSKARGDDDPESDIDLLLLTRRPLSWVERWQIIDALYDIQLEADVVFSTIDVVTEEWRHGIYSVLPLHDEVERDGVLV